MPGGSDRRLAYEHAVLLIKLFRWLDAMVGGDSQALRQWLANSNTVLGSKPIDKLQTISGLAVRGSLAEVCSGLTVPGPVLALYRFQVCWLTFGGH